ncbi:MAG: hypothetical protein EU541_07070 [Promethearchaeota archaeon]|nr:MAG: hypothetical protein EU541_07070 [Candidatus Lokiarchaeota archaeon]
MNTNSEKLVIMKLENINRQIPLHIRPLIDIMKKYTLPNKDRVLDSQFLLLNLSPPTLNFPPSSYTD